MISSSTDPAGFERVRSQIDLLTLTPQDFAGPILVVVGQKHREQEMLLFRTEGSSGPAGRWPALSPSYAARKAKAFGRKKILQLTGKMKDAFTKPKSPGYIQEYQSDGARSVYLLGARSDVAAAHYFGDPSLAHAQSDSARRIFFGTAPRLPIRDPISKTKAQVAEIILAIRDWYREKRIPQALRSGRR